MTAQGTPEPDHEALGQSEAFLEFQERLSRAAAVNRSVLLVGERGTGKELAAFRLHYLSPRWESPLVTLNCAALAPGLIESELFGHEAGAFTGATRRRAGRFEAAEGGTLFLDEIGAIPVEVQEKILRAVEYGAFERVGDSRPTQVDVRIVGATNADLMALAGQGSFKRDLLDRLSFEVLFLPPLRERKGDILLLANHFAARMAYELGMTDVPEFGEAASTALDAYPWPGNIRELKNVVERAVYRSDSPLIQEVGFDPFRSPFAAKSDTKAKEAVPTQGSAGADALSRRPLTRYEDMPFKQAVRQLELNLVQHALKRANYRQKRAAELLGLTYNQFRGYYRKYRSALPD